ncbi:hypothetical protein ACLB2K_002648 [Fragaria x ananassa]
MTATFRTTASAFSMLMDFTRALEICKAQCGKCETLKNGIKRLEVTGKLVTEVVGKLNGAGTQVSPELISQLEENSVQGKQLIEEIKKSALWAKLLYGSALETKADVGVVKTDVEAVKTDVGVVKTDVEPVKTDMWEFKDEIKSDMGAFKEEMKMRMGAFKDEMKGALRDGIRSDVQEQQGSEPLKRKKVLLKPRPETGCLICGKQDEKSPCGQCRGVISVLDISTCCYMCEKWFHGTCVNIKLANADHIMHYKCLPCHNKDPAYPACGKTMMYVGSLRCVRCNKFYHTLCASAPTHSCQHTYMCRSCRF